MNVIKLSITTISALCIITSSVNVHAATNCEKSIAVNNQVDGLKFGVIKNPPKGSDYSVWFPVAPRSLAIDSKGNIFVGDSVKYRVMKFDQSGHYLTSFSLQPPKREKKPKISHLIQDMAIDNNDNVYLINLLEYRVEIYDSNGKHLRNIDYFKDEVEDLNTKKANSKFKPKRISVDNKGNVYIYIPDIVNTKIASSGAIYSPNGKLTEKGVLVSIYGKGIVNFDEKQMVGFNGYYFKIDTYAPDKKLPGKTVDKVIVEDSNGNLISACDNLQIAKDEEGEIFKTDNRGNIYTFDYYKSLNIIKIKPTSNVKGSR